MPLDRHAERFLRMLGAAGASPGATSQQRRAAFDDLAAMTDDDSEAVDLVEDRSAPGLAGPIPLRVYTPLGIGEATSGGLVFLHGGGWVAGGLASHDGLCRRLANASGMRIIAVDYRLAPEHPFPAGLDDAFSAAAHVATNPEVYNVESSRLGIGGDSAGAGMAAAICQLARARRGPRFFLQLLICPITDVARETPSRREFGEGFFLSRDALEQDLLDLAPENRRDPRLSPLRATDFARLPPAFIHTAEFDPFRDEGETYARRLTDAGVRVWHTRHPGMIHYFYAMPRAIPYALEAAKQIGAEIG